MRLRRSGRKRREVFAEGYLSAVKLRRALRAELRQGTETAERPLHRSPELRKIFKQGAVLASADGGSLRPAHLLVALIEGGDPVFPAVLTKLGFDSFDVLQELRQKLSRPKAQEKRKEAKPMEDEGVKAESAAAD